MENEKNTSRKILYILLSVLVAVAFWIYVDEFGHNGGARLVEQEVTDIPIEYINAEGLMERDLMLLEESTSDLIDLTLEGPRRAVIALDRSNIRVTANLAAVTSSGTQTVALDISYADPNRDFSDVQVKKQSLTRAMIHVSKLSSKEVDIRCELVGNVAEGFLAGQLELSQDTIEIRGQSEDVNPVSYAKLTLNIGKDAENTVEQELTCQFYDENDRLLESEGILTGNHKIKVTMPVYMTKEVPLVMAFREAPGAGINNLDYKLYPESVMLSGEAADLRGLESIVLGEFDLLDLVEKDSINAAYSIVIPDGCQNLSGETRATLTVSFKDMMTATVVPTLYQIDNPPKDKNVTVLTESLPILIFGRSEDVASVAGENITVIMDLNDYKGAVGTYTVPVMLDIMADGDIGVSGTYQVQVRISEQVEEPGIPDSAEDPENAAGTMAPLAEGSEE